VHSHLDIARRYLGELWSLGHLEALPDLVAVDCTVRDPFFGECTGADSLAARIREMRRAFPGLTWKIDDVLADAGPQLAFTWSAFMRSTKVTGLLLLRFAGEKLVAITSRWDPHDLVMCAATVESDLDSQWDLSEGD
jgi:hypothetical protein